jgi:hypothetical protein
MIHFLQINSLGFNQKAIAIITINNQNKPTDFKISIFCKS